MEEIIMKDIPGYEGLYQATTDGEIWSIKWQKFMKQRFDRDGYKKVGLTKDGKQRTFQVHRLIGITYIPNPENKPCINHKDENKSNNQVSNLEWATYEENNNYGTRTERASISMQLPVRCVELDKVYPSAGDACQDLGIKNKEYIYRAIHGKQKTAGKYHWERV